MGYRELQNKKRYHIGNGSLWLTQDALRKVAEVLDGDEDLFDFISNAVNYYVDKEMTSRLDSIEKMLQDLLNGKVEVKLVSKTEVKSETKEVKPKVKIAATSGSVDLAKALQNMKKFT